MKKVLIFLFLIILTISVSACSETESAKRTIITTNGTKTTIETSTKTNKWITDKSTKNTTTKETERKIEVDITSLTPTSNSNQLKEYYKYFDLDTYLTYSKDDLISEIYDLISVCKIEFTYTKTRDYFNDADKDPLTGKCELFYSHLLIDSFETQSGKYNREHVWPQSLGHSSKEPGGIDLHHIRPCLERVNSDRGDKLYGNVDHSKATKSMYENNVYGYYTGSVFEPLDDVKGDVARICFYYSIKYDYDLSIITSDKTFKTFLEWNALDPVSEKEINRNNYVETVQGNRNIFIDYPDLANYIWN